MTEHDGFAMERDGAVLVYRLDRDAKRNAITRKMFAGLAAAAEQLATDPSLRVLLIEANGRFFSAGFEISDLSPGAPDEGPSGFRQRYRESARHDLYDYLESIEKPIVVAHQGPCIGAGLELSLSCDFRLASSAATYLLPELNTGLIAGSGGTSRLVRTVGASWARWLIMAMESLTADQALAAGLVQKVLPAETFREDVMAFCHKLAGHPPEVMAAAKLGIELARDLDRTQGRNVERLINSSLADRTEQKQLLERLQAKYGGR